MLKLSIQRLNYLIQTMPPLLAKIPLSEYEYKPYPDKWSKKEILGHLLDSATNNHHRFVRTQYEENFRITYDQIPLTQGNFYQSLPLDHLIRFWTIYNQHLLEIMSRVSADKLLRTCDSGDPELRTLEWLMVDYVNHLEHHLRQLVLTIP